MPYPAATGVTLTAGDARYAQLAAANVLTQDIELDGALNHDGASVGFYGVAPAARPSAYTQTYATADRTQAALTALVLTTFGAALNNTLVDVTTAAVSDPAKVNANFDDVGDEINKLIADLADVKQITNALIDDLQSLGIVT